MTKPMTKQRIGQYNRLQREIAMLENQIYAAGEGGGFVTDVVHGSTKGPPYAMHNIVIKGYGSPDIPRLSARKARCIAECQEIERFIDSLEDSVMRQMLTWRYIDGHSVKETGELVGYSRKQVGRLINSFFEKMSHDVP